MTHYHDAQAARSITVNQDGKQLATMTASFGVRPTTEEDADRQLEHTTALPPEVVDAGPTDCLPREEHLRSWAVQNMSAARREQFLTPGYVEIRPCGGYVPTPVGPEAGPAELTAWLRAQPWGGDDNDSAAATDGTGHVVGFDGLDVGLAAEGAAEDDDSPFNHALVLVRKYATCHHRHSATCCAALENLLWMRLSSTLSRGSNPCSCRASILC